MSSTFADVAEGVRATIAAYAQALDDGRTDDVVATFTPDAGVDIPGLGTHRGHDALRDAFAAVAPRRPQRHLVTNTVLTSWDDDDARATSDLALLVQGRDGWKVLLVGRYHDVLHRDGDTWRFVHRAAELTS